MVNLKIEIDEKEMLNLIDKKLNEIADEIFANSQELIVQKQIIDEGTLLKSGNINRAFLEKEIIYTAVYADSIEFGRLPGSMPPTGPIKEWIRRKGIASKESDVNRIAWAISQNIKKEGLMPRPFLSPAVEMAKQKLGSN